MKTRAITIFEEERKKEIQDMIDKRKKKWDEIENERQKIKDKIGQIMAQLEFWEAIEKPKDISYNQKKNEIENLKITYQDHVEKYKELAKQLDKEIAILEELL